MSFKKAIYAVGMGLLLTGCAAQDEPIPGTGEENQGGTGRYVNLSIVTDGSTRADGDATDSKFADGTNGESDVKKIALYFFNESKTCIFKKLIDASKINFAAPSPAEGSVELVGNVEVELTANGDYHYVVAVVNPNSGLYTDDKKTTLKEIANLAALQAERGDFNGAKTTNGFTMANSAYYDGDDLFTANPILSGNIYTKDPDAENPTVPTEKAVQIYVERSCAKVTVPTDITKSTYYVTKTGEVTSRTIEVIGDKGAKKTITIKPRVVGMGITNTNTDGYVVKNLPAKKADATFVDGVTFTFNDAANKRSYWETSGGNTQNNISWSEVSTGAKTSALTSYITPNTRQYYTSLANDNQDLATKLLVCAQLQYYDGEEVTDESTKTLTNLPLIRFSGGYYMLSYFNDYVLTRVKDDLAALTFPNTFTAAEITTSKDAIKKIKDANLKASISLTSLDNDMEEAYLAKVAFDDNKEGTNPDKAAIDIFEGYTFTDAALKTKLYNLVKADIDKVLKAITNRQIEYWKNGMTYFYVPVRHTGFSNLNAAVSGAEEPLHYINAVVRNHAYQISISNIVGLGTPVIDEEKGIDPERPDDAPDSYLNADIHVLKWRVSKSDNVTVH